jgi:hypothetical protein
VEIIAMKSMPRRVVLLTVFFSVAGLACHRTHPAPASTLHVVVNIPRKADSAPPPGGVVIDVDASLGGDYRQTSVTSGDGKSRTETTIGGKTFEVVGDVLHYGGERNVPGNRYGPLKAGDRVVLDKDGVLVNGARVKPMP